MGMDGIDGLRAALASPDFWQRLLVTYAIVLGVEAPFLLFVAALRHCPWYEQTLSLVPVAGFGLGLFWARQAHAQLVALQSYTAFQQTHYPPEYWPTFARERVPDAQALLASV